jgi:hypothetical protein
MKKIFLLLAFTGILGAASATVVSSAKATITVNNGDDKKAGDDKKKDKDKEKACCKKDANGNKACCKKKEGESKTTSDNPTRK